MKSSVIHPMSRFHSTISEKFYGRYDDTAFAGRHFESQELVTVGIVVAACKANMIAGITDTPCLNAGTHFSTARMCAKMDVVLCAVLVC